MSKDTLNKNDTLSKNYTLSKNDTLKKNDALKKNKNSLISDLKVKTITKKTKITREEEIKYITQKIFKNIIDDKNILDLWKNNDINTIIKNLFE
jgi:hypothetical protein